MQSALLFSVCVSAALCVVSAIHLQEDVTVSSLFLGAKFFEFSFVENGTVTFAGNNTSKNNVVFFAVFKDDVWEDLTQESPCTQSSMDRAAVVAEFETVFPKSIFTIPRPGKYMATILVCNNHEDTTVSVDALFMNGKNHLSADSFPAPIITLVIAFLWLALIVVWLVNWLCVRQKSKLHLAITLFLVIKICATIFLASQWFTLKDVGQVARGQTVAYNLVRIVEMMSFLIVLMLIAVGWGIVDNKTARKWPFIVALSVVYAACLAVELFFSKWFSMSTAVALCIVLFFSFVMATDTTTRLSAKVAASTAAVSAAAKTTMAFSPRSAEQDDSGVMVITEEMPSTVYEADSSALAHACVEQANRQLKMISRYRFAIILYIVGQLVCSVLKVFTVPAWVSQMVSQLFDLLLYSCIEFLFRLYKDKEQGMYYLLEDSTMADVGFAVEDEKPSPKGGAVAGEEEESDGVVVMDIRA